MSGYLNSKFVCAGQVVELATGIKGTTQYWKVLRFVGAKLVNVQTYYREKDAQWDYDHAGPWPTVENVKERRLFA